MNFVVTAFLLLESCLPQCVMTYSLLLLSPLAQV